MPYLDRISLDLGCRLAMSVNLPLKATSLEVGCTRHLPVLHNGRVVATHNRYAFKQLKNSR